MGIALPDRSEVEQALSVWKAQDPRLAALVERHGRPAPALRHYGLILWSEGNPQKAAQVLTGAVALTPDDARFWTDLSGALNASGALHQAAACIEKSLVLDGRQAEGWLRLGSIRSALEDQPGAEAALDTALALDPSLGDARLSLGLLCFGAKRFEEAVAHLGAVLQTGAVTPAIRTCYGQALSHLGRFTEAATAFKLAFDEEPENGVVAIKLAQAAFMRDAITLPLQQAVAACRARPFVGAAEYDTISRQALHLLSAYGHKAAAIRVGEARLAERPDDPECAYLLAVLRGEPISRSPDRYVAAFFDQFAEQFDRQLVCVLGYSAFQQLAALVDEHARKLDHILDLGCGTGLAGPLLAGEGRRMVGVDLSSGMLGKARERGCYHDLVQAEAVGHLRDRHEAFDLVFAADMLIYLGDLAPFLQAASSALKPGGLLAFTIEAAAGDLVLLETGRFAHGLSHVLGQAQAEAFLVLATKSIQIRYETQGYVAGELVVLRKPEAAY